MSTDVNLVELVATVRDRKGHLAGGLHVGDFEVLDNNQPRDITLFSEQHSQKSGGATSAGVATPTIVAPSLASATQSEPRSIALFFDDAHASMLGVRMSAEAARRLLTNTLEPNDLVGIFTSSGTKTVDFTSNRKLLLAALAALYSHPLSGVHATVPCPTLGGAEAYIITQHLDMAIEDAAVSELAACNCHPVTPQCTEAQRPIVWSIAGNTWDQYKYTSTTALDALLIVIRHLAAAPGERLLILMSPGFPTGGFEDRTSAITNAALRANIRISALNSEGLVTDRRLSRKLSVLSGFMADAATATGGKYLHDTNDWAGSLRTFVGVPEVFYLLGFSPPGDPDGKYHALKTRIRGNQGFKVESRTGYFAEAADSKHETVQQRIDRIAISNTEVRDFPVTVHVRQEQLSKIGASLHVTIEVDGAKLRYQEKEDRYVQELTFLTVLQDAEGNFIAGRQAVMDMVLTPETHAEILRKGIRAVTSFTVPQRGSYLVREVVRELVENRVSASSVTFEAR